MKKVFLSLAIIIIACLSANAQKESSESGGPIKIDIGVAGGIPLGDFGNATTFGIGGYAKGGYKIQDNVDLTLTADYKSFSGKNSGPSYGIFTVLAGGSYLANGGFHVDAGIGYGSLSVPAQTITVLGQTFTTASSSSGGFAYRAGISYTISDALDITANYNGISKNGTTSYIGIGIGYRILK